MVKGRLINIDGLNIYDPRGKIVYYDTFENGEVYDRYTTNGSATFSSTAIAGASSLKLETGNKKGDLANATLRLAKLINNDHWGFSIKWMCDSPHTRVRALTFKITYHDGTYATIYAIKWVGMRKAWFHIDKNGKWLPIVNGSQFLKCDATEHTWHHSKFAIDLRNKEYIRMFSDELEVYLKNNFGYSARENEAPFLEFGIEIITEEDEILPIFFDDLIITCFEKDDYVDKSRDKKRY